ncbi:DUF6331 family protein [Bremerella cremea]|uniref:DUF6331 family protein n=1 Tax=Bremerella cremea TaxID=1031537 RepID=UPI0031E8DBFD
MPRQGPHDINIGKEQWIKFVELDSERSCWVDLDGIIKPLEPFFDLLETDCVADCCGLDAYGLWPEDISSAAKQSQMPDLSASIALARRRIVETEGSCSSAIA